jgi:hypothetical protein
MSISVPVDAPPKPIEIAASLLSAATKKYAR